MKKTVCIVAILLVSLKFSVLWAYDFSAVCNGQKLYFSIISDTVPYAVEVVSQYDDERFYDTFPKGNLIIPSTVEYNSTVYNVKGIGYAALYNCVDLISIILPDSLEYISNYAFGNCDKLTTIVIPEGMSYIGLVPFIHCDNLISIQVDENNLYYKTYNGILYDYSMDTLVACPGGKSGHTAIFNQTKIIIGGAFAYCNKITSIDFGHSVSIIEDNAFEKCIGLTGTLILPNTLKYIGYAAFAGCSGLTDTLRIPDSVILIYDCAFYSCTGIKELIIGNSVEIIQEHAFEYCIELNHIKIGNSVKEIEGYAFCLCTNLRAIEFGNSVEIIGEAAFEMCTNLQGKITLPHSIKFIGFQAFSECEKITSVIIGDSINCIWNAAFYFCANINSITIGSSIQSINNRAFSTCSNLKNIIIRAISPPEIDNRSFRFDVPGVVLYVPCGSKAYYESDTNWNKFKDIQEADMEYMVSMDVNNNEYGIATASAPDCIKYESTLNAIPNFGYTFEKWSDGNSDNPRTVVVTSDTSFTAMFVYGVSIEESNSDQELRLYPNPAGHQFSLDNGQELMKEVYLYDIMGRKVQHFPVNAPSTTVDVSDLPNGIYVVKISTASGVLVRKVQVMR